MRRSYSIIRNFFVLPCAFLSLWFQSVAQQNLSTNPIHYIKEQNPLFSDIPELSFSLCYKNHTAHSYHERYEIRYQNVPVLDRYITLHFDTDHHVLSICNEMKGVEKLKGYDLSAGLEHGHKIQEQDILSKNILFYKNLKSSILKISVDEEYPQCILEAKAWSKTYDRSLIVNTNGDILREINYERNYTDTTIQAKIFNPDPLTTVQQNYGGMYVDSNDIHQSWMSSAYQTVNIPALYSVDSFYLENNLVALDEFEAPIQYPAVQASANFFFNRSQSGFEDVNVLYHLTNFHNYISSLGYDTLMAMGVSVDAHAQFGADNSVFSRNGGNPTLRYGTGGVDDAEDADVIIHEYAHGLSWSANGNDNFSNERTGLDEGIADYLATSYSRSLSNYHWEQVFNWDGHNEFWGGRVANSTTNYPIAAGIYSIGEIWNSAMSAIWNDLGATVTDKLMLEALHFFSNSTTLPEAAMFVLQADTLLFAGQFSATICHRFQERNVLDANCKPVGVAQEIMKKEDVVLRNTMAFAEGKGDALFSFSENASGNWLLYNAEGKRIRKATFENVHVISIAPHGFPSGIYFMWMNYNNKVYRAKLERF